MKKTIKILLLVPFLFLANSVNAGFVVDHTNTNLDNIPSEWVTKVKEDIHVAYNHTSHGSQLITGIRALEAFPSFSSTYAWIDNAQGDSSNLSLDDMGIPGVADLSQGDVDSDGDGIDNWAEDTYDFLNNPDSNHVNVIMWSWCNISGHNIERYLDSMEWLIAQFSEGGSHARAIEHPVQFVFITAHANGGGEGDSSDARNTLIRNHVASHNRILFDFSDIENYDPDENYYLDKLLQDDMDYDSDDSGSVDSIWASEYLILHDNEELDQLTHGDGVDGYSGAGSCAHSDGPNNDARLNCVLKGRAAWYLFARLVGWDGGVANDTNAPVLSNPQPSGILSSDTSNIDISLLTNENSTCHFSTSTGISYDTMTNNFLTTNSINHLYHIDNLVSGGDYVYYVRCEDMFNNQNSSDFIINFSIEEALIVRADVNQDSEINTTDAMLTLRNSLGLDMSGTAWEVSATTGDVNCDENSDSTDAMLLLRYSLELSMSGTEWCE